jgi:hypothetical protein
VCSAALVGLFGSVDFVPVRADDAQERALDRIDCAGGVVIRDESAAGKPVVGVSLCGAKVDDDLLKCLSAFPHLRTLDLCKTDGLTSNRLRFIANLKELEALNVSRCPDVLGHGLCALSALKNLRALDVSYCPQVEDDVLEFFAEIFPKLRSLDISGCKSVRAAGLRELRVLTALEVLTAADCDFTDAEVREIAAVTSLRVLSIAGSPRTTVVGSKALSALERLEVLDLSGSPAVTSAVLATLAPKLQKLQVLTMAHCPQLANHSLKQLRTMKQLHTLRLAGCEQLEDYGIEYLVHAVPNLKVLDLSGCPDINDEAARMLTKLNHLESLDLRGCKNVSATGAKALTDALPKLKLDR